MKRFCKQMAGTAGLLFILAACSNNSSSYPEEYVGFEKATKNYSFDKNKDTDHYPSKSPIMGTTTPFCFILPLAFSHVSLVHKCLKAV